MGGFWKTRLQFGEPPDKLPWDRLRHAWLFILIGPGLYFAALTQLAAPFAPFRGAFGSSIAIISWTGTALLIAVNIAAVTLIYAKRAAGLFLVMAGSIYLSFMIAAVMIAAVMIAAMPLGSLILLVGTVLLALWSLWGLKQVNARVPDSMIEALRQERLRVQDGHVFLVPATAIENGGVATSALKGTRSWLALCLEFAGVIALVIFGWVLAPLVIATDLGTSGPLPLIIWFCCVSIMLAARGPVNTWLLLARAMARGPVGG